MGDQQHGTTTGRRLRQPRIAARVAADVASSRGATDSSTPWLTSDGPLLEAGTALAKQLSERVPAAASAWYVYFSEWNAFAYFCAEHGSFAWIE